MHDNDIMMKKFPGLRNGEELRVTNYDFYFCPNSQLKLEEILSKCNSAKQALQSQVTTLHTYEETLAKEKVEWFANLDKRNQRQPTRNLKQDSHADDEAADAQQKKLIE